MNENTDPDGCQDLTGDEECGRPAQAIVHSSNGYGYATLSLCARHAAEQLERDVQSEWTLAFGADAVRPYL